ncbi:MAG: RNA polymerase sigma factor [Bacteroidales bacterium]|nr:RNA polymerase sigma factor [Bacteroidales bacterium]
MNEIDFRHDLLPLKNKLFRVALRITLDRPEAEDVVEDVLVKTWEMRHTPELQQVVSLESYCLTMTRNLALDRAKRREAQNVSLDDEAHGHIAEERADTNPLPDQLMERDEQLRWVHELFMQLPEKQRSIMQLRDVEEHSYQEIAEIMQITESDVKVTLFRARQALKLLIQKHPNNGL